MRAKRVRTWSLLLLLLMRRTAIFRVFGVDGLQCVLVALRITRGVLFRDLGCKTIARH